VRQRKTKVQSLQVKEGRVAHRHARSAQASPARIREFCGVISPDEARLMIREIEEAFEKTDAE
jgi:hypothetical protein